MIDNLNREIDYLRLSVTERCNLRCVYCMPESGIPLDAQADVLDFDETVRAVRLISKATGLRKLRVTGGEPLVRKELPVLLRMLADLPIEELSLTTNGVLLEEYAGRLAEVGVARVNVSIDSLRNDRLRAITRRGVTVELLQRGIETALAEGLGPVSVNCVVLRGINDDEVPDFISWARERPGVTIRFIEHMPVALSDEHFFPAREILERAGSLGEVETIETSPSPGSTTEAIYAAGGPGNIFGIVAPFSGRMCDRCNRIRLTARGLLRTCLAAPACLDLRHLLRADQAPEDEKLARAIRTAFRDKPRGHGGCIRAAMWMIGG